MNCKIGYIYALYYKGKPFYIGQTTNTIKERFNEHRRRRYSNREYKVYDYIKTITTKENFNNDIIIKPLKVVSIYDIDKTEMLYIKYCIDKGITIYNNCVKTNSYKIK